MKCKKSIMGLAALLILVFHFYIPFGKSEVEIFLWRSAYIGVDLFFFVSAYSLGVKEKIRFGSFIGNRLRYIYLPFVIMAVIATIYKDWELIRLGKVLTGVEFYERGGGAFLWFVIAIMIFYLMAPLFVKLKKKLGLLALPILLIGWALVAVLFQYVLEVKTVFIMINRMPIFILGFFYEDYRKLLTWKLRLPIAVLFWLGGSYLVYLWGTTVRLSVPFQDMYYVIAIPMVIGIVGIFDGLSGIVKFRNLPLVLLGQITFELYGLQMIFGYDIEMEIFKNTKKGMISFLLTALILIVGAAAFYGIMKGIRWTEKRIKEKVKNEKVSC